MTPTAQIWRGAAAAGLLLLATACVAPVRKATGTPLFFPPAPELPRLQYLTSFSGLKDVETQSAFNRFVVGEKQDVKLDKPYGVGIFDGKIYVCDTNATVVVFDLKKKIFENLKGAVGPGKLVQPTNISIEADGTKYVADPARGQIVAFDRDDQYVKAYGEPGSWRPVDAVAFEDRLYVADVSNHLVKVFDKASGELIKTIGDKGEPDERLDRPTNLAFRTENGDLFVTDFGRFQVVKFDRDGHYKSAIGKPGDGPGHFARPKGIAIDRKGQLFVVDASYNNVQVFNKDGRVLLFLGQGGEKPGDFLLPAKVAIDYDDLEYFREYLGAGFQAEYLVLVSSQFGPHAVSVLAYGYEKGKKYPTDEELLRQLDERQKKELEEAPEGRSPTPERSRQNLRYRDPMSLRIAAAGACFFALFSLGCSAASRHKALTTMFDGVPPLKAGDSGPAPQAAGTAGAAVPTVPRIRARPVRGEALRRLPRERGDQRPGRAERPALLSVPRDRDGQEIHARAVDLGRVPRLSRSPQFAIPVPVGVRFRDLLPLMPRPEGRRGRSKGTTTSTRIARPVTTLMDPTRNTC